MYTCAENKREECALVKISKAAHLCDIHIQYPIY
jgi:hypothetical protein